MKQILEESKLIGKTIKATGHADNTFALFFADETYTVFFGWDDGSVELMDEIYSSKPTELSARRLRDISIIKQEQYDKIVAQELATVVRSYDCE